MRLEMSSNGMKQMATKRERKSVRGFKDLAAKRLRAKEAGNVRGGYIGETEKLGSSASSIGLGNASKR
jgi:hypothetical protein